MSTLSLSSLQEENRRLKRAVEELSILNELATEIGTAHDSAHILEKLVRRAREAVHAEQTVITMLRSDAMTAETVIRVTSNPSTAIRYRLQDSVVGWIYTHKQPLVVNDCANDVRFKTEAGEVGARSLLAAPLMVKAKLIGVLTAYNQKDGGGFTADDKRLIAILASQSAQILERARLYQEEQRLERLDRELELAAEIQRRLVPATAPEVDGYQIAATMLPARLVGGDLFDFIPVEPHRLAFCLGDASGKGLPAALLMANLQAILRGQALAEVSEDTCLRLSNTLLYRSTGAECFATVFYGVLDSARHALRYCNGGHNYPFFVSSAGAIRRLSVGGPVLGVLERWSADVDELPFQPGDALVVFSDGVTEATDERDEPFGEDRLGELIVRHAQQSPRDLIDIIVAAVRQHATRSAQTDDMTLVVMKRV